MKTKRKPKWLYFILFTVLGLGLLAAVMNMAGIRLSDLDKLFWKTYGPYSCQGYVYTVKTDQPYKPVDCDAWGAIFDLGKRERKIYVADLTTSDSVSFDYRSTQVPCVEDRNSYDCGNFIFHVVDVDAYWRMYSKFSCQGYLYSVWTDQKLQQTVCDKEGPVFWFDGWTVFIATDFGQKVAFYWPEYQNTARCLKTDRGWNCGNKFIFSVVGPGYEQYPGSDSTGEIGPNGLLPTTH